MAPPGDRSPQDLDEDEAERLRRVHVRLRKASQDLEAFTVPVRMKGRWENAPVPEEALAAVRRDLAIAYDRLWEAYGEVLGWRPPARRDDPA